VHVHSVAGGGHTRRDFLFHMLTISAGLLIAVAVEHVVESFHERGQRQQLTADLRDEGLRNRGYLERDIALLDASLAWLDRAAASVRAARAGRAATYPSSWDAELRSSGEGFGIPTSAVWSAAGSNGTLRLLPRTDAFAYARLYFMHDLVVAFDLERRRATAAVRAAELAAGASAGNLPSLAAVTAAQLDELGAAIAMQQAVDAHFRTLVVGYHALNDAVLAGDRSGSLPAAGTAAAPLRPIAAIGNIERAAMPAEI
jgi:hypothetical protein